MVKHVIPNSVFAASKPPFYTTALKIRSRRKSYLATGRGIMLLEDIMFYQVKR
jgi:hypothetical protein